MAVLVARLEVLGEVDARGAVRFHVGQPSMLCGDDGKPLDVLIENFSQTGFLFLSDRALPAGTLFAIGLSGAGSREARVVWRDGTRHGCEFLVPLPQSKMERAFTGQAAVLAGLEAALQRRLSEPPPASSGTEEEVPEEKQEPAPPSLQSLLSRLAEALRRHHD